MAPAVPAAAQTDVADLTHTCDDCHGTNGRSDDPEIPSIGGFSEFAIMDLMQTYRDGLREGRRMERSDGTETDMVEVSQALTDQELEAVALHYADKTWTPHPSPSTPIAPSAARPCTESSAPNATSKAAASPKPTSPSSPANGATI